MYSVKRTSIFKNWDTKCYISKKLPSTLDKYGNEIPTYEKPKQYTFNIQPVSGTSEAKEFGEIASQMRVAVITERDKYINEFNEFDLAYLDGTTPNDEKVNGEKANYRVYSVMPQNVVLKVYFLKLNNNQNK
jgi:hypothetical protein